jgi:hypothetical protein
MKKHIKILCLTILSSAFLFGAEYQTTGTTGFVFLNLPVSARSTALGQTGITLQNSGAEAIFINPALMAEPLSKNALMISYGNWYVETSHQAVAFVHHNRFLGSFGLSMNYFDFGTMEKTRNFLPEEVLLLQEGDNNVYINEGTYSAGAMAVGLSYGRQMTQAFKFGVTAKYIRESIDKYYAENLALDLGFMYETGFKSLRVGTFLKNFGLESEYVSERFKMPQVLTLGISGEIFGAIDKPNYVTLLAEAVHPNDSPEHVHFGLESKIAGLLMLRGGYKLGYETEALTGGLGIDFDSKAQRYRLDISYMNHDYLGHTMRYTLTAGF